MCVPAVLPSDPTEATEDQYQAAIIWASRMRHQLGLEYAEQWRFSLHPVKVSLMAIACYQFIDEVKCRWNVKIRWQARLDAAARYNEAAFRMGWRMGK